ncbi:T9SS type A sorting domain-containing protein [Chryseobacterium sp.]|uniref:T9SS type A sorting domain-containing protein n=1 Tax=Chryseobacterium sp. TaxID=1871047 RepID=UPI0011CC8DF7|nr:T9SS type A sorting domain-containing protein [Chryseobacterium sp.]TXF77737.1 T9SS type A sorting domain-containing protein [Chryseobacterium sp.]
MKKLLFSLLFIGSLTVFSEKLSAQTIYREPATASQKSDDGVLVAYPNPARDFIIVKAKDSSVKIKSVTFYSILGMQMLQVNVNMNSGEINLEKLRPGKYLMRYIMTDNTQRITQIIKQ